MCESKSAQDPFGDGLCVVGLARVDVIHRVGAVEVASFRMVDCCSWLRVFPFTYTVLGVCVAVAIVCV